MDVKKKGWREISSLFDCVGAGERRREEGADWRPLCAFCKYVRKGEKLRMRV